jgi:hypothetical protein
VSVVLPDAILLQRCAKATRRGTALRPAALDRIDPRRADAAVAAGPAR